MILNVTWLKCSFIWTQGRLFKKATETAFIIELYSMPITGSIACA